jgi:YD repeat-containing protein
MSTTEEPDALIAHVRICGESARLAGLIYPTTRNLETTRLEGLAPGKACPATPASYTPAANTVERKVTTAWHPDWRLETRQAEPKKLTTWVYNGQPDPTNANAVANCAPATALLPGGKPITVLCKKVEQATTDLTGASGLAATQTGTARVWSYTYNATGQVLTVNGPRTDVTDVTTYAYYTDTTATHRVGDLSSVTDAAGHVTQFTSYDAHGHPLTVVDVNNVTTTLDYYPRGWLKSSSVGPAAGPTLATSYVYDNTGLLKTVTHPDGAVLTYSYDDAHRLTGIADSLGNTVTYVLDAMGNRKVTTRPPSHKSALTGPSGWR